MAMILVVEDDVFVRGLAEAMIIGWGHQILSAADAPEALAHLHSSAHIDALFTDINLKADIHGGCGLAEQALALRPQLHILYTTANQVADTPYAKFTPGAHFLPKPYTEAQLESSIQQLLAA